MLCALSAHGQTTMRGPVLSRQPSAGTPPSVVQSVNTGLIAQSPTIGINGLTAGNVLITVQYWGSGSAGILDFTDSLGNTSTRLASAALAVDGDTMAIICAPITTGGNDIISFRESSTIVTMRAVVYEVHNSTGTCVQDAAPVSSNPVGHVTSCNSGSITTTTPNDLLIVACGGDGTSTSAIPAGVGWSGGANTGNGGTQFIQMSEWQIATTPGPYTGTSGTIASQETSALTVALKP